MNNDDFVEKQMELHKQFVEQYENGMNTLSNLIRIIDFITDYGNTILATKLEEQVLNPLYYSLNGMKGAIDQQINNDWDDMQAAHKRIFNAINELAELEPDFEQENFNE